MTPQSLSFFSSPPPGPSKKTVRQPNKFTQAWSVITRFRYSLTWQDCLPVAPDLTYTVIGYLEILPRLPGRADPDLPGYYGSFRDRAELLDLFAEHPRDILRVLICVRIRMSRTNTVQPSMKRTKS